MNRGKPEGMFRLQGKIRVCDAFRRAKGSTRIAARMRSFIVMLLGYSSSPATAAAVAGEATLASGSMLQVMLGLVVVLAVMAGAAWLLKRFGSIQRDSRGAVKIIGASAVGQRERVVLVEVADTWLVIGVAPGHVTGLHTMPKGQVADIAANSVHSAERDASFSTWFKRVIEKRDEQRLR
ncbi:MAG TPA: flagellar biosynthetic protein FliO [Nitrosospira sp.]|nr:flagellar biosynthetic protein FliO [Nitrosospira sp.]